LRNIAPIAASSAQAGQRRSSVQRATDEAPSAWPKSRITERARRPSSSESTSSIDSARERIWSKPSSTSARDTVVTGAASRVR
jgi:hypothetical protein